MTETAPGGETSQGTILWRPSDEQRHRSRLAAYMGWLRDQRQLGFADYQALWQWSVDDLESFWTSICDHFEIALGGSVERVLSSRVMPGARWFSGAHINYAEQALRHDDGTCALIYRCEDGTRVEWSRSMLRSQVARARGGLRRLGVEAGDRVVAFLPNCPEALVSLLATASLGAIWSSCPPEFGSESVLDRFRQIEPKVLIATDAYPYNGKTFDRSEALASVVSGLPSLEQTVLLARNGSRAGASLFLPWEDLLQHDEPLAFEPVGFEHPLWILYSSGTTGLPKAIVHGHGGIVLEHFKQLALHCDLGPGDRFFWFSTTGWMMWNYLVSGLLVGATVVLYEGSPGYPDLLTLFRLAEEEGLAYLGTSAPFIMACRKAEIAPRERLPLARLRALGSTGAPLPVEGFLWVYEQVKKDLMLASICGGTDVCTAFIGSCPLLPVRAGEIQCHSLGCDVDAFDERGRSVHNEVGELVLRSPMPSMPIHFWNDEDGERYRQSYFEDYPGVWRHGDWVKIDDEGRSVIYGRSDSTLNRGGVRMGTSEFYRVIETLPEITDSLVVDTGSLGEEGKLWLFLVLAPGQTLDAGLLERVRQRLRASLSPRHVPDEIRAIPAVPVTLSGKKLEVPIKKILTGTPLERAVNPGTLGNPTALETLLAAVD